MYTKAATLNLMVIALIFSSLMITSCDGILDSEPRDRYSDAVVWEDEQLINLFLNDIYKEIPSEFDRATDPLATITDEAANNRTFTSGWDVNRGDITADSHPFLGEWGSMYEAIRKCNVFLENIEDSPVEGDLRDRMIGEVYFLRSMFYLNLYNFFGRFPIVEEALSPGEDLFVPRASEEESIQFMIDDLNEAASRLPLGYSGDDVGRATEGAALAMKSRIHLYAENWQQAADAAQEVMDLGMYDLFPDYGELFHPENEWNEEVIFAKRYTNDPSARGQSHSWSWANTPPPIYTAGGIVNPTGNLVDAYEFQDGTKFDWENPDHAEDPYSNRDPRFYDTVVYDGVEYLGETFDMRPDTEYNPSSRPSVTGYYLRKMMDPGYEFGSSIDSPESMSSNDFIVIRYAEVLLNYAEAQYEMGNIEEARNFVNKVRERNPSDPQMPPISSDEFDWDRYEKERRIELAFEGHRLWDINRWEKGPEFRGSDIYEVVVSEEEGEREYDLQVALEGGSDRYFDERMYLFPIPFEEIQKYPSDNPLEQNPGW